MATSSQDRLTAKAPSRRATVTPTRETGSIMNEKGQAYRNSQMAPPTKDSFTIPSGLAMGRMCFQAVIFTLASGERINSMGREPIDTTTGLSILEGGRRTRNMDSVDSSGLTADYTRENTTMTRSRAMGPILGQMALSMRDTGKKGLATERAPSAKKTKREKGFGSTITFSIGWMTNPKLRCPRVPSCL